MAKAPADTSLQALVRKAIKNPVLFGEDIPPTDFISTGLPSVDYALGRPGIACGRMTVIRGEPSTSKSSLLYRLIAECQRRDGVAVLFETELGIERSRLESFGVDWEKLVRIQPACVEELFDDLEKVIEAIRGHDSDVLTLIGWDSVAATPTRKEIEGDSGDASMGMHSRLISQGMRKYTSVIARHRIAFVIVNQFREKLNAQAWAETKTMIADKPLRFHASQIVDVAQVQTIATAKGANPIGIDVKFDISKNKLGAPRRKVVVPFFYATGFDVGASWRDLAERTGVVKKNGAWFTFPGGDKLQRAAAGARLREDVSLQAQIQDVLTTGALPGDDEEDDE